MAIFKVPVINILGLSYYRYELSSNNYNPSPNGTITITCLVRNVFGNPVTSKEVSLYENGELVGTVTTDSGGIATWTVTCSNNGLRHFEVGNQLMEVYVDNKANSTHTHTKSQITNFAHNHTWTHIKDDSGSTYDADLYVNENIRMCHLRLAIDKTGGDANTFYGNDADEWTSLKHWIPSGYVPTYQAQGSMNYNGSFIVTAPTSTDNQGGTIFARFGESWNGTRTLLGSVYWRY